MVVAFSKCSAAGFLKTFMEQLQYFIRFPVTGPGTKPVKATHFGGAALHEMLNKLLAKPADKEPTCAIARVGFAKLCFELRGIRSFPILFYHLAGAHLR